MSIEKITELLGVKNLDESVVTEVTEIIKSMIDEKVEAVATEKAKIIAEKEIEEKKEEIKGQLLEEYEEKFETYKDDFSKKFSLFVDEIIAEKLEIPENVKEYARKGELYDDLIEQFKIRLGIDEGLITSEMKDLMNEAKDEIIRLRDEKNHLTEKYLEGKSLIQEASASLYILEKCKGLTEAQKEKVTSILEGITDKEVIDEKFDIIVESITEKVEDNLDEAKIDVKVVDPESAIKSLKKLGVSATKKMDDKISIDTKDKKKVVKWMLSKDGGWEKKDIEEVYPELLEGRDINVADPTPLLKEEEEKDKESNFFPFAKMYAEIL